MMFETENLAYLRQKGTEEKCTNCTYLSLWPSEALNELNSEVGEFQGFLLIHISQKLSASFQYQTLTSKRRTSAGTLSPILRYTTSPGTNSRAKNVSTFPLLKLEISKRNLGYILKTYKMSIKHGFRKHLKETCGSTTLPSNIIWKIPLSDIYCETENVLFL